MMRSKLANDTFFALAYEPVPNVIDRINLSNPNSNTTFQDISSPAFTKGLFSGQSKERKNMK